MIQVDDLKPGDWVAIIDVVEEEDEPMGLFASPKRRRYPINGKPLKVLVIDLPFICVTDGSKNYSLHSKFCTFKKLKRSYVQHMLVTEERDRHETTNICFVFDQDAQFNSRRGNRIEARTKVLKPSRKKKEDKRGQCPQCGTRLRQRLVDVGTWNWVCPECGFTGGNSAEQ